MQSYLFVKQFTSIGRLASLLPSPTATIAPSAMPTCTPDPEVIPIYRGSGLSLAFAPDGRTLAAGIGNDVRLWRLAGTSATAAPIALAGHDDFIWSLAFSPDGQMLAAAGREGTIRLWRLGGAPTAPTLLTGHREWVRSVAFSPDGQMLASGGIDGTVRLWRLDGTAAAPAILMGCAPVAFSPDGQVLASGGRDGICLWPMVHPSVKREA